MTTLFSQFAEARLRFDAARREEAELARQALEMKLLQRDFMKVTSDLKAALERLEADRAAAAAPAPPKPATAAPAPKATVPARKPTPKPAPKPRPKPPQTIDDLEARLSAIATKISALASRLSKSQH